jgi:copper chaperone CopZ
MERVTMRIEGMTCGHCVRAVEEALRALPGVEVEQVAIGEATVAFDPARTPRAELDEAVRDAGYELAGAGA